jgi:hypothetical protein
MRFVSTVSASASLILFNLIPAIPTLFKNIRQDFRDSDAEMCRHHPASGPLCGPKEKMLQN